ncbi:alpha/beta fold hydrolase [Vitiosangium sp. GDMCC 1.1324]|uniref:alpha/beta fold hydrolase n=1 Tax=Vitiosangium sp. (strain GDMCC 1.1324) TaxID=2138576 RepID=UPI000D3343DA|nr:alpha/beta fold hydrolase [Vitiosangium sp. GDMCC 1.1324]PTL79868.1 alpha/beta hydrolase [Vitiosangium sp. GDMCC 1.1324]
MSPHILFLPGAGGAASFWYPLGALLPSSWRKTYLSWPGLGLEPHDPAIQSLEDAVAHAASKLERPSVVVAQSMGGVVAVRLALAHPERISHLVLTATSGGVDMAGFGASDWRIPYRAEYPNAADWILTERTDLSAELHRIAIPTLLLWGDADPISPVGVGRRLEQLLPRARLRVLAGGDHAFSRDRAAEIAPWVAEHLRE